MCKYLLYDGLWIHIGLKGGKPVLSLHEANLHTHTHKFAYINYIKSNNIFK